MGTCSSCGAALPDEPTFFSERFRGTPWGRGADPAPRPRTPGEVRKSQAILVAIGLFATGGILLGVTLLFPPAVPLPIAPPRATATPTPLEAPVINAFVSVVRAAPLTYHFASSGAMDVADLDVTFEAEGDFRDDDVAMRTEITVTAAATATAAATTAAFAVDLLAIGGQTYGRLVPDGKWLRALDVPPIGYGSSNVLRWFRFRRAIHYVGAESRGGVILHHLQVSEWIGGETLPPPGYRMTIDRTSFDLWVDDDGIPREASLALSVTLTGINDNTVTMGSQTITYRFSDFGRTVQFTPPPLT